MLTCGCGWYRLVVRVEPETWNIQLSGRLKSKRGIFTPRDPHLYQYPFESYPLHTLALRSSLSKALLHIGMRHPSLGRRVSHIASAFHTLCICLRTQRWHLHPGGRWFHARYGHVALVCTCCHVGASVCCLTLVFRHVSSFLNLEAAPIGG